MTKQRRIQSAWTVIRHLGWPLLLGLAGYTVLMVMITRRIIANDLLDRYLTSHPVSYLATGMFFIGVASLAIKGWDVFRQSKSLRQMRLPHRDSETPLHSSQLVEQAEILRERWVQIGQRGQNGAHYLYERLLNALDYVIRRGSAEGLEEELKYQAELDAERQHESFALVRILIWATPMLGFLGTVIGISEALGGLSVGDANDFDGMMNGLRDSLYVAFDTTALALTLSIALMFFQFFVDRFEQNLLYQVEQQATNEVWQHFDTTGASSDPVSRSIERSGLAVLSSVEALVERQSDLWQQSFLRAQEAWSSTHQDVAAVIHEQLRSSVEESLTQWHSRLADITEDAEQRWQKRWEQLQIALTENARRIQAQQEEFVRHGEVLNKTVTATGDVIRLETALNDNLQSLSASANFEEAIQSLSAAIHLLNTRLAQSHSKTERVDLQSDSQEKAA